ncbi:MAG: hypothetical protein NTZ90_15020 [Proteobacteria bacterium]|nr:hypothetical protein [Pseudomonadota bacterium]
MTMILRLTSFFVMVSILSAFECATVAFGKSKSARIENRFKIDNIEFKLVAEVRDVTTSMDSHQSTKISYSVFRNGTFLHPEPETGGTLIGCRGSYVEDEGGLVLPIKAKDRQVGWFIWAGARCGATVTYKVQIVLVDPKPSSIGNIYKVMEIQAKEQPLVRDHDGGIEVWFTYQEYGNSITVDSFLVPRMIFANLRPGEVKFEKRRLDPDFSKWPKLNYIEDDFRSYFVAGLNDLNAELMRNALAKLYRKDSKHLELYARNGFPSSFDELTKVTDAVSLLNSSVKEFLRPDPYPYSTYNY